MTLDLTPAPVLQELIDDLETKIYNLNVELSNMDFKMGARYQIYGIEKQIEVLEEVLKRVIAQQDLIDKKQNSISLN